MVFFELDDPIVDFLCCSFREFGLLHKQDIYSLLGCSPN